MAPHSSPLAWRIPRTEEPGGLRSMGSLRVGHDWATSLSLFTFTHWRRKWQPTPVFLPGESQGRGWPGGLPSMGSHRIRHDWSDLAAAVGTNTILYSNSPFNKNLKIKGKKHQLRDFHVKFSFQKNWHSYSWIGKLSINVSDSQYLVFVGQGTSYLDTYIRRAERNLYKIIINEIQNIMMSVITFLNCCLSIRMGLFGKDNISLTWIQGFNIACHQFYCKCLSLEAMSIWQS